MEPVSLVLGLLIGLLLGVSSGLALAVWGSRRWQVGPTTPDAPPTVDSLLQPVTEQLARVERQLGETERLRDQSHGELRAQVEAMRRTSEALQGETGRLVGALRAPQVRGRWGEMQLRRVVEASGMLAHCDFVEQPTYATDDGLVRPDLVVNLAGGKHVVVDAKVAFAGYLEALEATSPAHQSERLAAHARHLRQHVDALAGKQYWEHVDVTPEFVVMFVPAEPFLTAALDVDPSLLEHAFTRGIVIATPATLVALLRTVAYTWRQEVLADNAHQVLRLGQELQGRLTTWATHLGRIGSSLESTVRAYNSAVGSLESRVLVTARRFADLQGAPDNLETPAPVDLAARRLTGS